MFLPQRSPTHSSYRRCQMRRNVRAAMAARAMAIRAITLAELLAPHDWAIQQLPSGIRPLLSR